MKFFNTLRKKLPFDDWLPGEPEQDPKKKPKALYIVAVTGDTGQLVRLATKSFDHLRANLRRFHDNRVNYIARRWGRGMKEIDAFAVYSEKAQEQIRTKDQAFAMLSAKVMSDPK